MAHPFQSPLLTPIASVRNTITPQFADDDFWSNVMFSPRDFPPAPAMAYTLITDTGDELVDAFDNQLIAVS